MNIQIIVVSKYLGKVLEEIRQEKQMSKKEFYELIGLSKSHYDSIIKNEIAPNINTLEKICHSLQIYIGILMVKIFIFRIKNEKIDKSVLLSEKENLLEYIRLIDKSTILDE